MTCAPLPLMGGSREAAPSKEAAFLARAAENARRECGFLPTEARVCVIIAGYRQRETLRRGDDGCLTVGMPEDVAAALHVWRPAAEHLYPALPRAAFAPAQVQFVLDYLLWLYREIGSTPWGKRRKWRSFSEFAGDWLRRFIHNLLSRPYIDPNLETAAEVCPWLFTPEGVGAVSYALLEKHL